jgi:hypothetical protein
MLFQLFDDTVQELGGIHETNLSGKTPVRFLFPL